MKIARLLVTALLAFGLTLLSPGGPRIGAVFAQVSPAQADVALQRLDMVLAAFESLRGTIDRRQFDASALGLELAFEDPEDIVGYVRDRIYFEQYPGLLRGVDGTLMSRAGNALDQAVLLAQLLGDAGYETRVATGRIDEMAATQLLQQMMSPRAEAEPFADYQAIETILAALEEDTVVPPGTYVGLFDWFLTGPPAGEFEADVAVDYQAVTDALTAAGVSLGDEQWLAKLVEEAREYAWVEYRLGSSDRWVQAHPAFHEVAAAPTDLVASDTFAGVVPGELVHRLRVEAVIERRLGDEVVEAPIMAAWERPVPNLIGVPVTYWNVPEGLTGVSDLSAIDIEEVAAASTLFFPLLMGNAPDGARAFDLLGNAVPAAEASSPMAGIFRTTGAAFGTAGTALGGLGGTQEETRDAVALVSQTLRFTFVAPDGTETTYQRTVEPIPGDKPASVSALSTERTFMVSAGALSDGFVLDRMLQRVIMAGPLMKVSLQRSIDPDAEIVISTSGLDATDTAWLGHLLIFQAFDSEPQPVPQSLSYRNAPTLVVRHVETIPTETGVEVIDVVTNPRRSFSWVDGQLLADPGRTLRRGVWETHTEGVVSTTDGRDSFTTMAAMREADGSRRAVTVVVPGQSDRLVALAPDETSRASMQRDLDAGYSIVVPADVTADERTGWWRVDATSGETLGIVTDGRGAVVTEVLGLAVMMSFITVFVCFAVAGHRGNVRGSAWDCLGAGVGVGLFFMAPQIGFGMFLELLLALSIGFLDVGDFEFPF
ncbi:MAG: hypothetical protein KF813_03060 [Trueperaceae bacterium]|nr:hypothetical protein [Trueperaceae bacterium]